MPPQEPAAPSRLLLVDDSDDDLELLKDALQSVDWGRTPITTVEASSGHAALDSLAQHAPIAVLISDMAMPGMSGSTLLAHAAERFPTTVRIVITGLEDQATAISAINEGAAFRFLAKPVSAASIRTAVLAGLEQHRLLTVERDMISQTLMGTVTALMDLFSRACPVAYERATRVRAIAREIAAELDIPVAEIELAALLSQLGFGPETQHVLSKFLAGHPLTPSELGTYRSYPQRGAELLERIPRLEGIGRVIRYQNDAFAATYSAGTSQSQPLGARILKVALDFDRELLAEATPEAAFEHIQKHAGTYDAAVAEALRRALPRFAAPTPAERAEPAPTR